MDNELKNFLIINAELLKNNNFVRLYDKCLPYLTPIMTDFFLSIDINPLVYMSRIPEYYLMDDDKITFLSPPYNITIIGEYAFRGCSSLKKLKLNNIRYISANAFEDSHLEDIQFSALVQNIGNSAFKNCQNLKTLSLGENVEVLGSYSFENCINLETVYIPESLKLIGFKVFNHCYKLKRIIVNKTEEEFMNLLGTGDLGVELDNPQLEIKFLKG